MDAFNYGITKTQMRKTAGISFDVNWKHWLALPVWTPMQAVCLLHEICPNKSDELKVNTFLQELTQHAELKGKMTPYQWQQFGIEQNEYLPPYISDIQELTSEPQAEPLLNDGVVKQDSKNPNDVTDNVYTRRVESISKLIREKEIVIGDLNKEQIYQRLIKTGGSLWDMAFLTFDSEFWQPYAKETNQQKPRGRPKKNK